MIDNSMCKDCKFVCLMYCFFFLRMNMCKKKSCFKGLIICVTDIFEIHKLGKVTQCVKAIYSGIIGCPFKFDSRLAGLCDST